MNCHSAEPGLRRLAWTLLAAAGAGLWLAAPAAAQNGGAPEATYEVTFQGTWTTAATPGGVVGNAHFTTLIGAVHNNGVSFWRSGGRATQGVELVAETGETTRFASEVDASAHARAVVRQRIGQGGTSSATFTVDVTTDHPLVTLLSMIGPSPDWFVGVSGLSLQDDSGHWVARHVLDLYPYDAGTEEGTEFSLNNPPTDPQGTIASIRGMDKFSNQPMARLTFVLQETPDMDPTPVPALPLLWPTVLTVMAAAGGARLYLRRR